MKCEQVIKNKMNGKTWIWHLSRCLNGNLHGNIDFFFKLNSLRFVKAFLLSRWVDNRIVKNMKAEQYHFRVKSIECLQMNMEALKMRGPHIAVGKDEQLIRWLVIKMKRTQCDYWIEY